MIKINMEHNIHKSEATKLDSRTNEHLQYQNLISRIQVMSMNKIVFVFD